MHAQQKKHTANFDLLAPTCASAMKKFLSVPEYIRGTLNEAGMKKKKEYIIDRQGRTETPWAIVEKNIP